MGGLGNQMFQYAYIRTFADKNDMDIIIDLKGITNKIHNVYGLNHCNISSNVRVVGNYKSIRSYISYLLYGFAWVIFKKNSFYEKYYIL